MTSPFTIREEDGLFRVYCFHAGMYAVGSREDAERLKRSLDYEWARHNPTDDDIRGFLEVYDERDEALARAESLEKELTATSWKGRDAHAAQLERETALRAEVARKDAAMREALNNLTMLSTGGDFPETCRASAMFLLQEALTPPPAEAPSERPSNTTISCDSNDISPEGKP